MQTIDIGIDYEEVQKRQKRWDDAMDLRKPDRVPVLHYLGARFWLPLIGLEKGFNTYLNDPRVMLESQLKAGKWIMEHVDSDFHKIVCYPDFMWAEDIESWGALFEYPDDDSPWVARPHLLQRDSDLEQLRQADFVHGGIHGKMFNHYRKMIDAAADYRVRFSDGKILDAVDLVYMGGAGIIGPMVMAGDLMSVEDLSIAFFDKPDYVRELLEIIVDKSIEWIDAAHEVSEGRTAFANDYHEGFVFIGDDGTAQMSPQFIQDFARTPAKRLADHIRGKGLKVMAHNCGRADHLLGFWADEVGIDRYIGFSYLTDKEKLREVMGGRISVIGGVNTAILHDGTPDDVREDVKRNIQVLKDVPGFVLMDGHNVAPGTPVENLNAVTEAARSAGSF
jgi:hypothetical protein